MLLHFARYTRSGFVHVRLDLDRKVAKCNCAVRRDVFAQDAGRQRFVEDMTLQLRMSLLERGDQLRQYKELVSSNKDGQSSIRRVPVDVRNIVYIGYTEFVPSLSNGIVCSFAPGWNGLGIGRCRACNGEKHQQRRMRQLHIRTSFAFTG